ncbi:MAG: DUF7601 domain-containing protein [Peptoanaerobacter stomatis]
MYTIRVVDTGNDYGKVYWEDNELPFPYQIKIKNDKILVQPPTTTSKTMLEVSKLVRGDNINIDREFTFELKLKNSDDIDVDTNGYIYEKLKSDGSKENLTLSSEGIFKLKHDEKIVLKDIPGKTKYKLTEKDYGEDYKPEVDVYNGTITTESQVSVQFINNMTTYGQLRLEKQVTGSAGDKNKKFEFVVNIDSDKEYDYVIKNKNNEELATSKIRNGGKIYLADGEYAIISGIKVSTNYEITEKSYSSDGYTTTVVGKNVGTIETKDEIVIKFINNRDGGSGGDNPPPTTPKEDPKTPPTTPKEDPKTTPKEDPKTPPTTPKEDPKTTPKEDPKTPPTTPDSPPETPDTPPAPSVPSYPRNNPPDPNDPNSPETIVVVDENGVPLGTYTKRTNPDGTVEYVDEDGVPLGGVLVKTGNEFPENALIITSMVSLLGLVILRRYRRKDK